MIQTTYPYDDHYGLQANSPWSIKPARAPKFSPGKANSDNPHTQLIYCLYRLGWNVSAIARMLPDMAFVKAHHLVTTCTQDVNPLTFAELFKHIPFSRLIDPSLAKDFAQDQTRRLYDMPKEKLTPFDIHMIKVLCMIGWKKKRVAKLYQVSAVLISVYSSDLKPYTVDELVDLLPLLTPTPAPSRVSATPETEIPTSFEV